MLASIRAGTSMKPAKPLPPAPTSYGHAIGRRMKLAASGLTKFFPRPDRPSTKRKPPRLLQKNKQVIFRDIREGRPCIAISKRSQAEPPTLQRQSTWQDLGAWAQSNPLIDYSWHSRRTGCGR